MGVQPTAVFYIREKGGRMQLSFSSSHRSLDGDGCKGKT